MTLFRQIMIAVLVLFVVLYAGNTVVSLNNNRILVEEQMRVHAQDTATSLALSMSQVAQQQDMASLDAMFNAVSDSGFFQHIYFANLSGKVMIERRFPVNIEGVPSWFIEWANLPPYQGEAEVIAGWTPLGKLTVVSHPGQAYLKLWQTSQTALFWFMVITFVACVLVYAALRVILNPLARVEGQANAISEGDFQIQLTIPAPRELKNVVEAMNRMAVKLKQLFADQMALIAKLREQSHTDLITGLANRADFDARLKSHTGTEIGVQSGVLAIIAVSGLADVNQLGGRRAGNDLLKGIADKLLQSLIDYPEAVVARRQGVEFTLFIPDLDREQSSAVVNKVFETVQTISWRGGDDCELSYAMGFVFQQQVDDVVALLSFADTALKKALQTGTQAVQDFAQIGASEIPVLSKPIQEWQQFIQQHITDQAIQLHYQPVYHPASKQLLSHEVYVRFPSDDQLLSAGTVVPVAERLGLMPQLDKLILEKVAEDVQQKALKMPVRVNLSAHTVRSNDFHSWLDNFLSQQQAFAKLLIIEVAEHAMHSEKYNVEAMNVVMNKYHAQLCIDHFGLETSAFSYLGGLRLHSLKVHRSFVAELASNADNQFYIKALANLAHNLDIKLYIEGVESESAYNVLADLHIDGCQGYFLGEPANEPVDNL